MHSFITAAVLAVATYADGLPEYIVSNEGAAWTGTCATGLKQSPIDLKSAVYRDGTSLKMAGYTDAFTWRGPVASERDYTWHVDIPAAS